MKSSGKKLRLATLVGVTAWLAVGCGGINTTHSVSPATFFMPGLIQNQPSQLAPADDASGQRLAWNR